MKKRRSFSWKIPVGVVASCFVCLVLQGVIWEYLQASKARFVSENHYHITLGRLQNAALLKGKTVMLGSSITERLISSNDTAVIGVPGSAFLSGMQFVPYDSFPPGTVFVLEANNMLSGIVEDVLKDTKKWDFRLFQGSRHFSIVAKPSSLILSLIYHWKNPLDTLTSDREVLTETPLVPCDPSVGMAPPEKEDAIYAALADGIRELRSRGYRLCIAYFPERDNAYYAQVMPRVRRLAHEMNVPLLDYSQSPVVRQLIWTDDRHLDSRSLSTSRFRNTLARDADHCAR